VGIRQSCFIVFLRKLQKIKGYYYFCLEFYQPIMNYSETLEFLYAQLPMYQREGKAAYKANLDVTIKLDEHFRHPHQFYPSIHVAGTNGKGSVSHMIAAALQQAGFRTGLYTSPHLRDFRERIRIDGEMITEKYVTNFVEDNQRIIKELKPSFFEITAAMAFDYFARERVDVAVIETGMGGRLDSTNIINPIVSVITNIGLDHTHFLGNTLDAVAREKAGIIKKETPVIVGEKQAETMEVFAEKSQELAAPVTNASDRFEILSITSSAPFATQKVTLYDRFIGEEFTWKIDLTGHYQAKNLVTVLATLDAIRDKFPVSDKDREVALRKVRDKTGFRGRWDILDTHPLTVADTAHNTEGLTIVMEQLNQLEFNKLHIVIGVVDDKNLSNILKLLPQSAAYYFTRSQIPRALNERALRDKAYASGLHGESYENVADALHAARASAGENDLIYIGGSTFVVAEALT